MSLFGDEDVIYDDELEEGALDPALIEPTDGLSDPRAMTFCAGHEEQEKLFLDLITKNNLPHAMIFSGPDGIGKSTMAFRLARF